MRKRLVKRRKRINGGRSVGHPRGRVGDVKKPDTKAKDSEQGSLALVELGRRAVERGRSIWESERAEEEIPIAAFESDGASESYSVGFGPRALRLICGFVVGFSLLTATVITCFSFALAVKHSGGGEEAQPPVDTSAEAESNKVVFVRPVGGEGGALSAPELYAQCAPSVVTVSVSLSAEYGGGEGVGTGFILSENGYIATAEHVVAGARELFVVLSDGKRYEARAVASEKMSDIALLKIDASGLSAVSFGVSSELLVGERVYAIGTPAALEYAGTLTSGEVSYANRILPIYSSGGTLEKKLRLIQTNAELNSGSSGSPLFDEQGRVVGIVTMRLGGDYSGIGFAIPSDGAVQILEAMMAGKELNSAILSGAVIMAPALGVIGESAEEQGAYGYKITGFTENGSGVSGSLRIGDLIIKIDDTAVYRDADIFTAINKKAPRDTVSVTVIRSGQRLTFDVILGG